MTAKVRRLDYYPDEYIAGVGGVLRADEQGVYWMICSLIMSEGGEIELNERRLSGLCMMRPSAIRRIIDKLVSTGKVNQNGSKLYQKRVQSELELASKRIQSATENGSKGGRPRKIPQQNQQMSEPDGLSAANLTTNYQLPTTNIDIETPSLRSGVSARPRANRATRIPENFSPEIAEAEALGLSPNDALAEAANFVDYWCSKPSNATKLDWNATWRVWCRKAAKDGRRTTGPPRRGNGGNVFADLAAEIDRKEKSSHARFNGSGPSPSDRTTLETLHLLDVERFGK